MAPVVGLHPVRPTRCYAGRSIHCRDVSTATCRAKMRQRVLGLRADMRLLRFASHAEPPKSECNSEPVRDARVALRRARRGDHEVSARRAPGAARLIDCEAVLATGGLSRGLVLGVASVRCWRMLAEEAAGKSALRPKPTGPNPASHRPGA